MRKKSPLALLPLLLVATSVGAQDPPPPTDWKVFQEFGFLNGSWSGPAESGGRVGGRVVSFTSAVGGAQLSYRATTFYPAKDALPESSTEEVAYIVYDGGNPWGMMLRDLGIPVPKEVDDVLSALFDVTLLQFS